MLALMAVLLSCGLVSGCALAGASAGHPVAFQRGVTAGRYARQHHRFRHNASHYDVAAFCIKTGFRDIQKMNHFVLDWTQGFEKGCLER
jgi:hypothetical protein